MGVARQGDVQRLVARGVLGWALAGEGQRGVPDPIGDHGIGHGARDRRAIAHLVVGAEPSRDRGGCLAQRARATMGAVLGREAHLDTARRDHGVEVGAILRQSGCRCETRDLARDLVIRETGRVACAIAIDRTGIGLTACREPRGREGCGVDDRAARRHAIGQIASPAVGVLGLDREHVRRRAAGRSHRSTERHEPTLIARGHGPPIGFPEDRGEGHVTRLRGRPHDVATVDLEQRT